MRSDAQRSAKFDAKTVPTTMSLKIAAQLATMKTSFDGATNALVDDQLQVAQILDAQGIVGLMRGRYHAYGNRLHHISQNFTGAAATNMAQLEHDKWEDVCQDAILILIAFQVFGYVVT